MGAGGLHRDYVGRLLGFYWMSSENHLERHPCCIEASTLHHKHGNPCPNPKPGDSYVPCGSFSTPTALPPRPSKKTTKGNRPSPLPARAAFGLQFKVIYGIIYYIRFMV